MFSSVRERVLTRTRVNKEVSLFFGEKKTRGFLGEHKVLWFRACILAYHTRICYATHIERKQMENMGC